MWLLLSAIATASLLGSLHCVGMCGPLAIWAAGADRSSRGTSVWLSTGLYHLGRGVTYAIAGVVAGSLGQLVDWGGSVVGVQLLAARIVGGMMIVFGVVSLWRIAGPRLRKWLSQRRAQASGPSATPTPNASPTPPATQQVGVGVKSATPYPAPKPNWFTAQLLRLRPIVFKLPLPLRGLSVGLLTALLPCGWLYLFALLAAGTGSIATGALVMVSFWIGSVPLLVGLVAGTRMLGGRVGRMVPLATSILLVAAGAYTASGRGFASLSHDLQVSSVLLDRLKDGQAESLDVDTITEGLQQLVDTPLPCCENCLKPAVAEETSLTSTIVPPPEVKETR